jgi:hypothetical protein
MVKIIIAGGRDFTNREGLLESFHEFMKDVMNSDITVISGTARGADLIGEWIAHQYSLIVERYPADWNKYGRSAGYKRNELMATKATHLLAAWDGQSKGTKHMIDLAKRYGLETRIHDYCSQQAQE